MRPETGGTRCPKDCPRRSITCHNEETCETWKKQKEEDRQRLAERDEKYATKRRTWEERGIRTGRRPYR